MHTKNPVFMEKFLKTSDPCLFFSYGPKKFSILSLPLRKKTVSDPFLNTPTGVRKVENSSKLILIFSGEFRLDQFLNPPSIKYFIGRGGRKGQCRKVRTRTLPEISHRSIDAGSLQSEKLTEPVYRVSSIN